jgi:hypothetical protein
MGTNVKSPSNCEDLVQRPWGGKLCGKETTTALSADAVKEIPNLVVPVVSQSAGKSRNSLREAELDEKQSGLEGGRGQAPHGPDH